MKDVVVYDIREYRGHNGEFIGRGSPLGNKFRIGVDGTRDDVVDKYAAWIQSEITSGNKEVIAELQRLRRKLDYQDIDLLCYCAPRKCHGDVIAAILRTMGTDGMGEWKRVRWGRKLEIEETIEYFETYGKIPE